MTVKNALPGKHKVPFYSGVSAVCWRKNGQTQDAKWWKPVLWITNGIVNNPQK